MQAIVKNDKFVKRLKYMAKAFEQELFQYILQLDEAEKKSVLQMLKTLLKAAK
jgi:hypothetical protein